jgi:hypothetical protein
MELLHYQIKKMKGCVRVVTFTSKNGGMTIYKAYPTELWERSKKLTRWNERFAWTSVSAGCIAGIYYGPLGPIFVGVSLLVALPSVCVLDKHSTLGKSFPVALPKELEESEHIPDVVWFAEIPGIKNKD